MAPLFQTSVNVSLGGITQYFSFVSNIYVFLKVLPPKRKNLRFYENLMEAKLNVTAIIVL